MILSLHFVRFNSELPEEEDYLITQLKKNKHGLERPLGIWAVLYVKSMHCDK